MLIIFGGLPGVGKTTLARRLAEAIGAVYVRVDTIETAITNSSLSVEEPQEAGYLAAYGIAEDNLRLGLTVVADSVNSIEITRSEWRKVAVSLGIGFIEIEVICSDKSEHRRRVEQRLTDIRGQKPISWQDVLDRDYEEWLPKGIQLDSAQHTADESLAILKTFLITNGGAHAT